MPRTQESQTTSFVTIPQAVRDLKVSRPTITRWIAAGQIRTVKLGKRRMIPNDEFARILTEGVALPSGGKQNV